MKKKIKILIQIVLGFLIFVIVLAIIYLNFSPQFGGTSSSFESSNFKNGKFKNYVPTPISTDDKSMWAATYDLFFKKNKDVFPKEVLDSVKLDKEKLENLDSDKIAVAWLGHSTTLIKTKGISIITDPVFNTKTLPPMYLGPKKFPYTNDYDVNDLPKIDIVLISHDHYDHLDMESVKKLKDAKFYVPLGVKVHLLKWGINKDNVFEFDWYDELTISEKLLLALTPARHFSGRKPSNARSTLWGAWVIKLEGKNIYFGGDSGYFEEFKKVGEKYGPFDMVMLDSGKYGKDWRNIHMLPNEVVRAGLDLKAKAVLPIHNSKYVSASHAWYDPLEQVTQEAETKNLNVTTPRIGQIFMIGEDLPKDRWWRKGELYTVSGSDI